MLRKPQSKGSLLRESSRGRVVTSENRQNSDRLTRQSEDYSQARLIYRANSDLNRRFQTENSPKIGSMKTLPSTNLAGNNTSVSNFNKDRLTRLDSHIQQRQVTRDNSRHQLGRESSILKTSNSRYKLIRNPSSAQLQRDNSSGRLLQSHSLHSLARGNSSNQLQRQSSNSHLGTLTRAKSRGQVVTELCTRSVVSPQK